MDGVPVHSAAATDVLRARLRICWLAAAVLLLTAAVPLMPTPALAAALISFSFFWCLAISTNLYAMPIDFFGARHAAFGVSILTASYGLMQTVLSPLIGSMVDHFGFPMVCVVAVGDAAGGDRHSTGDDAMTVRARDGRRSGGNRRDPGASPEASQWDPGSYLDYECSVATERRTGTGIPGGRGKSRRTNARFSIWRWTRPQRRRGVARKPARKRNCGARKHEWFLEVRASNSSAIKLYESAGFREAGGGNRTIAIQSNRGLS